jgi:signal transduction histidine kinase/CheY-like chemotaxis protein
MQNTSLQTHNGYTSTKTPMTIGQTELIVTGVIALATLSIVFWVTIINHDFSSFLRILATIATILVIILTFVALNHFKYLKNLINILHGDNERMRDYIWELSENHERASDLFNQLGDLVVTFDAKNVIFFCNANFAALFNKSQASIIGQTLLSLGVEIATTRSIPNHAPIDIKINNRWYSWIELRSFQAIDDNQFLLHAVARDIHFRKESEAQLIEERHKAEAANLAKSHFLATVSHEIRTPLNGITGMSQLLNETQLTLEQKTYVDAVLFSSNALMSLIEDLLDFSKIESGTLKLRNETIEIRHFCENLVELVAHRAFAKHITLSTFIDQTVPKIIQGDMDRLRQAVLNLLGNAIKFTHKGGIYLDVTAHSNKLFFSVHDTGKGVDEKDKERIFEQFEQVNHDNTHQNGGIGLGLAITKKLISAMKGGIKIESQLEKGSIFTIELPLNEPIQTIFETPLRDKNCIIMLSSHSEAHCLAKVIHANGGRASLYVGTHQQISDIEMQTSILLSDALTISTMQQIGFDFSCFQKKVILIEPRERTEQVKYHKSGFKSYLIRPVREKTLITVLLGKPKKSRKNPLSPTTKDVQTDHKILSILVAEDNAINALLVTAALMRAGHHTKVLCDGFSVVDEINAHPYTHDLILMDLNMPIMNGLESIAAIREGESKNGRKAIPILALTADSQVEVEKAVYGAGGNGYLIKPIDPKRLIAMIEETAKAS